MAIKLTEAGLKELFPAAADDVLATFVADANGFLAKAGVTATRTRLAYFFANISHESVGLTTLVEDIGYTAARMAAVWPNRFRSAADVQAKYGTAPGWQEKAFDDIYGNRMGNLPGTRDGSQFIGRSGAMLTGRDAYAEIGARIGLPLTQQPNLAADHPYQADICAAFWSWKGLNQKADIGDFTGAVKLWNGGTNGLADRQARLARMVPIIAKFEGFNEVSAADVDAAAKPAEAIALGASGATVAADGAAHLAGFPEWAMVAILVLGAAVATAWLVVALNRRKAVAANVTAK